MIDNQHQKIKGYRDLSESEIQLMNKAKELANNVGEACEALATMPSIDKCWLAIAKTDLQKGFVALIRSIAQPTTF